MSVRPGTLFAGSQMETLFLTKPVQSTVNISECPRKVLLDLLRAHHYICNDPSSALLLLSRFKEQDILSLIRTTNSFSLSYLDYVDVSNIIFNKPPTSVFSNISEAIESLGMKQ